MTRPLLAATLAGLLGACALGPDYERPAVELPESLGTPQASTPAPQRWWALFGDAALDALIAEALEANRDLRAAAERVEQARAQLEVARAEQIPTARVEASRSRDKATELGSFPLPPDAIYTSTNRLALRATWEIDFWGKYRRASQAARAELAASEAGRDAVRNALAGDVARGYFELHALDGSLAVAERTLRGRAKALELAQLRFDNGMLNELELNQVRSDLLAARALVPQLAQRRLRQEGALAVLLGRSPRAVYEARIDRGVAATPEALEVPAALPSDLLLRRADLRQAEERLKAANARIGVARAAYFPSIRLTGLYGGESQELSDLFLGRARAWSLGADLLQPLFAGGQLRGGVDLANARTREAALAYVQAIAVAFREVREAIADQAARREVLEVQRQRERALERTVDLARLRYDNGVYSLFELLDAERQLLAVRLNAIEAERDRRHAIVDLYLALGG